MIQRALKALVVFLALTVGVMSTPTVFASGNWFPVTLTCAGVTGIMRSGIWTFPGAAGETNTSPFNVNDLPYPFGTQFELQDGSVWTILDTGATWVPRFWIYGEHFDLYMAVPCSETPGMWPGWARIIRWGW